jgi:hypothetical protein
MTSEKAPHSAQICLWILAGLLTVSALAMAQAVEVTSADPASAEQDSYNLRITISGESFGSASEVEFLVTGTDNPDGIQIKRVKRRSSTTLVATIDVAPDATVSDFDIRVHSGGSTGIGTGLFAVTRRSGGWDSTPPDPVTDLELDPGGEMTFSTIPLTWTASADDMGDPASGPASHYDVKFFEGHKEITEADRDSLIDYNRGLPTPGLPGDPMFFEMKTMVPDSEYSIVLWVADENYNQSPVSNTLHVHTPPVIREPWKVSQVGDHIGFVAGLGYDFDGTPVIGANGESGNPEVTQNLAVARGSWDGQGLSWSIEVVGPTKSFGSFAFDPVGWKSMFVGINDRTLEFLYHDGSRWVTEEVQKNLDIFQDYAFAYDGVHELPTITYVQRPKKRRGLWVARRYPTGWQSELVDPSVRPPKFNSPYLSMAFDPSGSPWIVYSHHPDGYQRGELRLARWTAQGWGIEVINEPGFGDHPAAAWDPYEDHFVAADSGRFCRRIAESNWVCDETPDSRCCGRQSLFVDGDGKVYLAYERDQVVMLALRATSELDWTVESVDYTHAPGSAVTLALDPQGIPSLVYNAKILPISYRDASPNDNIWFAWRPSSP